MVRWKFKGVTIFLVGVTVGYLTVGSMSFNNTSERHEDTDDDRNGTLLIAVVTANSLLQQRAEAISTTWAQTALEIGVPVLFFTGEESKQSSVGGFPLIHLPGVDDTYPPQRKVIKMLQYLQTNYMQKYKWLLRADDDLYVRVEELVSFLNTLDHHKKLYMGQPGLGKPKDLERLKLYSYEHFCMGGPGVFFSSSLLSSLVEHLEYCLQNVVSYNEDVEIGRCISRQLHIQCTWAYDLSRLFYMDYSKGELFRTEAVYKDKKLPNALTVHAFKKPLEMYKIHQYFIEVDVNKTIAETSRLEKELTKVQKFTKKRRAYAQEN